MAEKLIVEFYNETNQSPIAVILVRDHGEDPSAAAVMLMSFIASVKTAIATDSLSAGDLVARFILWEAEVSGCCTSSRWMGTFFIPPAASYPYQLARVRTIGGDVHLEIVTDEYSTDLELGRVHTIAALLR